MTAARRPRDNQKDHEVSRDGTGVSGYVYGFSRKTTRDFVGTTATRAVFCYLVFSEELMMTPH